MTTPGAEDMPAIPRPVEAHAGGSDPSLLRALAGTDAERSLTIANRTRRAVQVSVDAQRHTREQKRFQMNVAAAVGAVLLLLLAPALWSGIDALFGGEHFSDLPTQVAFLIVLLFVAIMGALIAGWKTRAVSARKRDAA